MTGSPLLEPARRVGRLPPGRAPTPGALPGVDPEAVPVPFFVATLDGELLDLNRLLRRLLGLAGTALPPSLPWLWQGTGEWDRICSRLVRTGAVNAHPVLLRRADGHVLRVELDLRHVGCYDPAGRVTGTVADRTRDREREELLRREALHDRLTGLANRRLFHEALERALRGLTRQAGRVALLFVDLDGFKEVNDRLGHEAGYRVLVEVARRLVGCVRPTDVVARYGGDEFAVLVEAPGQDEVAVEVAARIAAGLGDPVTWEGAEVPMAASVGVAFTGSPATPAYTLLERADRAMYIAKASGGSGYHVLGEPSVRGRST